MRKNQKIDTQDTPTKLRNPRHQVHVTQKEIDEGLTADSRKCMIAEAVKNSIPNAKTVAVDLATIRYTDKKTGDRYTYMTPYFAQQALIQFDQGIKPSPFDFQLRTLFQIRPRSAVHRRTPTTIAIESGERRGPLANTATDFNQGAPVKIGGKPIPKAALGYIRRFGLRTLPTGIPATKPTHDPINQPK